MAILNADVPRLTLEQLPRNHVGKAVLFVVQQLDELGRLSPDDAETLYRLQDDPAALIGALEKLGKDRKDRGLASL